MKSLGIFCILFLSLLLNESNLAQETRSQTNSQHNEPLIITVLNERLRVVAIEPTSQLHIEIFSMTGERVFDSEIKSGNILDWNYRDRRGDQLPAGTYLCRVTMKSLNGQISLQQGTLTLSETQVAFANTTTSTSPETDVAITLLAHDGEDGRVVSSRGGLRFYSGNVFAGREVELMRITEQGYLGIGIQSPQARLDVNGMIRTHGIVFPDGSIQTSALSSRNTVINKTQNVSGDGGTTSNIGGSGTTGKLPKWTDGASGTLGDSIITELTGNIGIGTTNPSSLLHVAGTMRSDKLYVGVTPNAVASTDFRGVIGDLGSGSTEYYFTNIAPSYIPTNNVGSSSNNFFGATLDANIYDTTATGDLSGRHTGGRFRALTRTGSRTVFEAVGGQFNVVNIGNGSSFGNVTNAYAGLFSTSVNGGSIVNSYGAYIGNPNGAGSITNNYGLYLEAQAKGTNNWAIYAAGGQSYFNGNVGIGILSPTAKLQVAGLIESTTGGIKFPDGTTQTTAATGNGGTVTAVTASAPLASTGNTTPNIALTGVVPISNGGTGSATQNFIDLSTSQSIGGLKTFTNALNTASQYNINGNRILGNKGTNNLFAGIDAGNNNTTGTGNSFFGAGAGRANTTGDINTFFGQNAGAANTTACCNSFFGQNAGAANTTGVFNAFFGEGAGSSNTTGDENSFFGESSGVSNTTGKDNTFMGNNSGANNVTGSFNTFIGDLAGFTNGSGDSNSFLGSHAGILNTTGSINSFFGVESGMANTTGQSNSFFGGSSGSSNTTGQQNTFIGVNAGTGNTTENANTLIGYNANGAASITNATAIGANASVTQSNSLVLGATTVSVGIGVTAPAEKLQVNGDIRVGTSGTNGCLKRADSTPIAGTCSSDARFKQNITPFPNLLDKFIRLQPVHYYWRTEQFPQKHFGTNQSYGLIAQEVERVLPELVSEDEEGFKQINYSKLPLLTIQAVKELKNENNELRQTANELKSENQSLKQQNSTMEQRLKILEQQMQMLLETKSKTAPQQ